MMSSRRLPMVAAICALAPLSASAQAQTFYNFEAVSPAAIAAGSWAWGDDERPLKLDGFVGVNQYYKAPGASADTLVSTPLCINTNNQGIVGHAFAKKVSGVWKTFCRSASGTTQGVPLLKPTGQQLTRINFIPHSVSAALPRAVAPIAKDSRGVDVYVCRVNTSLGGGKAHASIGTLLPGGTCKTAPGYQGGPASVEASSFELMVTKADAAPAVGWIYLKENGHHPRGSLVQWPSGATYCQGRARGMDSHGTLETNADGSIRGCSLFLTTGAVSVTAFIGTENLKVFRNDGQSGVGFETNGSLPAVTNNGLEACAVYVSGVVKHQGIRGGPAAPCITLAGVFSGANGHDVRALRRKGAWPNQG